MSGLRFRILGVLVAALVTLGGLAPPAHAEPASLTGTLTDEVTGAPLAGCVTAYKADDMTSGGGIGCADETGAWTIEDLVAGTSYVVVADPQDRHRYFVEWFEDAQDGDDATAVTAPATVSFRLRAGGRLEGTLTDEHGEVVPSAIVEVQSPSGAYLSGTTTDEVGRYSFSPLRAGQVKVRFSQGIITQWAFGQESLATAEIFDVADGQTTTVDDQLIPYGVIRGTVTDAATGAPVNGACVQVLDRETENSWAYGCVGADGRYSLTPTQASGTYALRVTDAQGRYAVTYSGGAAGLADAKTYTVTRESEVTVDLPMRLGGRITGRVLDQRTEQPIEGVCPRPYPGREGKYLYGPTVSCSDASGTWSVAGLPAGSYAMHLVPRFGSDYSPEGVWLDKEDSQATANLYSVSVGETVTAKTAKLVPAGVVTGVVTDQEGRPVSGAWVNLAGTYPDPLVPPGGGPLEAWTDEEGRYTLRTVPDGDYTPVAGKFSDRALAPTWFGGAASAATADVLTVTAGKTVTADIRLLPGGFVEGTVLRPDGSVPEGGLDGRVHTIAGEYVGWFEVQPNTGTFRTSPLPPGDLVLSVGLSGRRAYYDRATTREGATPVRVERGETRQVTFHLP